MLTLDFINVGYGDAILARETRADGGVFSMLVDCGDLATGDGGPGSRRVTAAQFLQREGVRELDLLVLTHLHLDHVGGLGALLESVRVREFWCNYLPGAPAQAAEPLSSGARNLLRSHAVFAESLRRLRAEGTTIRLVQASRPVFRPAGGALGVQAFCEKPRLFAAQERVWKAAEAGAATGDDLDRLDGFLNNTSIRLRLTCGAFAAELPGDVYAACWQKHEVAQSTVVKLPHHGHRDALTAPLLERLAPQYAVISVSNDRTDDCPSAATLGLLRARGVRVCCTDAVASSGLSPHAHFAVRFRVEDETGAVTQDFI